MWLHLLDEKVERRGTQLTPHRARLRGSVRFHAVGASLGVRPSTSRRNLRRKYTRDLRSEANVIDICFTAIFWYRFAVGSMQSRSDIVHLTHTCLYGTRRWNLRNPLARAKIGQKLHKKSKKHELYQWPPNCKGTRRRSNN